MSAPITSIVGPRQRVRHLPILSRRRRDEDWDELWLHCPERGAIGLEHCMDCGCALEIVATDASCYDLVLRCQARTPD